MKKEFCNFPEIAIESQTLQERVFDVLKENILSGAIAPNASLNTNELAKKLNVSRTPVRDAVNRLVSMGLAVKANHKEARVADYMSDEMFEMFCARAALEGVAASFAARTMSREDKIKLVKMAEEFRVLHEQNNDEAFMKLNQEFHFMIYSCLKTQMIRDMAEQLYVLTKRNRDAGFHILGRSQQVVMEHSELAQAILTGDHELAESIGIRHHKNTINNLKQKFENLKEEYARRKI